jgi:hypothetical protein
MVHGGLLLPVAAMAPLRGSASIHGRARRAPPAPIFGALRPRRGELADGAGSRCCRIEWREEAVTEKIWSKKSSRGG